MTPPIRVLACFPHADLTGGAERSFAMAAPLLIERGVDLHLAVLSNRGSLLSKLDGCGIEMHDLSEAGGPLRSIRALRSIGEQLSIDLVHACLFEAAAVAQIASLGAPWPVLVTWANTNFVAARSAEPGATAMSLWKLKTAETVLGRLSGSHYHAVTTAVGELNGSALRVRRDRVHVGERGRSPNKFPHRAAPSRSDPCRPVVVLAIGRQDHQKGYPLLIRAIDELQVRHPGAQLWIAGRTGSGTGDIDAAIRSMKHPEAVRLLGQRDDIPDLLARADVVACASWREGAAGALIEAMAVGTPIVTVDLEGLKGVFVDGVNAVVVERSGLVEGISRVIEDPDGAVALTSAARRDFESRFTLEASADRLVEIYRSVIGR